MARRSLGEELHHGGHFLGKGVRCASRSEASGAAAHDDFAGAGNIGGNGGQGACAGLEQPGRKPFPSGGKDEAIRGLHPRLHILLEAEKADPVFQTEAGGELAQVVLQRSIAGDEKAGRPRDEGEGAEERGIVLYGLKAAGGKPKEFVVKAEFAADGFADAAVRTKLFDVYPIPKHSELFPIHHSGCKMGVGNGLADGGNAICEPIAGAIADASGEVAGGSAVQRVDDDIAGRASRTPA